MEEAIVQKDLDYWEWCNIDNTAFLEDATTSDTTTHNKNPMHVFQS